MSEIEIDKKTLYEAVKDAVTEILSKQIAQEQLENGYGWMYKAVHEGTKEAMIQNKK